MAGDWIKIESVTPDKPELSVMAEILGIDQDAVFGKLFRIWAWADQNIDIDSNANSNDDSVTVRVTKTLLDRVALCPGFAASMVSVGWLIESGTELVLPNFRRHNGKSAKNRGVTAKRAAKFRNNSNGESNADTVTETCKTALPREEIEKEELKAPVVPSGDTQLMLVAYHAALPKCKPASVLNPKRKRRIAAVVKLAKSVCAEQGWPYEPAGFWSAYFAECAKDAWMRGEVANPKNSNWKQNLDVLIAEDRFAGVMDGAISAMRSRA
jgi:hypothetical protein